MALKLSFIIEAIDRATAPIRAINRMLESTTGPLKRVRDSWGNLSGQVRGIATNLTLMTGAAAGVFYPLHRMIDEGSQIYDMAKNLAISTREFQRLAYALTLDGGSAEDAGNALKFLERNAVSAVLGNQEMATWFRRAGMSAEFLRANLSNPTAMLNQLADSMSQLPEGALRTDLSLALLGRSGNRLNQTLSKGRMGLKEVGDEAESLGVILDEATIAKMKEAGDGMQKVWRVLRSVTALIATAAIPLIEQVGAAIIEWTKANRELTAQRWTEIFDKLSASLPKIIKAAVQIAAALGVIAGVVNTLAGVMGGWDNVIVAIAGVIAARLVIAVMQLGRSLYGLVPAIVAAGTALLTTPIGWFLLGVAAIAGAVYLVYRNWEPISKFFTDLWEGVKSAFGAAVEWISEKIGALAELWAGIRTGFASVVEWISGKIAALTGLISSAIVKLNELVPDWIKHGTLPGIALNTVAGAVAPGVVTQSLPSAIGPGGVQGQGGTAAPAGVQQANVGGTIRIEIDQHGRARVASLKSDNRDVNLEVYSGQMMVMP